MKLEAKKIEKSYKSRKVVNGIDLELKQGEIVGLLGPNGAGKTTCFYMIVGLIKCDNGLISINEIDISRQNYINKYYQKALSFRDYQQLRKVLVMELMR